MMGHQKFLKRLLTKVIYKQSSQNRNDTRNNRKFWQAGKLAYLLALVSWDACLGSWTLKTSTMNRLKAFEMWCYRRILKMELDVLKVMKNKKV